MIKRMQLVSKPYLVIKRQEISTGEPHLFVKEAQSIGAEILVEPYTDKMYLVTWYDTKSELQSILVGEYLVKLPDSDRFVVLDESQLGEMVEVPDVDNV